MSAAGENAKNASINNSTQAKIIAHYRKYYPSIVFDGNSITLKNPWHSRTITKYEALREIANANSTTRMRRSPMKTYKRPNANRSAAAKKAANTRRLRKEEEAAAAEFKKLTNAEKREKEIRLRDLRAEKVRRTKQATRKSRAKAGAAAGGAGAAAGGAGAGAASNSNSNNYEGNTEMDNELAELFKGVSSKNIDEEIAELSDILGKKVHF